MTFKIIDNDHKAKIRVVGVGGAGGNAINRMVASGMHGVEFIAINTDGQVLEISLADICLCIGDAVTHGLGAGAKPELGRQAIEEDREKVAEKLMDTDSAESRKARRASVAEHDWSQRAQTLRKLVA